jgi:hypothetical protein
MQAGTMPSCGGGGIDVTAAEEDGRGTGMSVKTVTATEVPPDAAVVELIEEVAMNSNSRSKVVGADDSSGYYSKGFWVLLGGLALLVIVAVAVGGVCLAGRCSRGGSCNTSSENSNNSNVNPSGFTCSSSAGCVYVRGPDGSYIPLQGSAELSGGRMLRHQF